MAHTVSWVGVHGAIVRTSPGHIEQDWHGSVALAVGEKVTSVGERGTECQLHVRGVDFAGGGRLLGEHGSFCFFALMSPGA